jgi:hypothetical protein
MISLFNFLLAGTLAFSQNKVGNGGDVVNCAPSKIELLDFYESGTKPAVEGTDPFEIAKATLSKIRNVKPSLSEIYLNRLEKMKNEIDFKDEIELTDIKDSKHLYKPLPKECKVEQIAIRKNLVVGKEKRFLIRNDFWKQLKPDQQAGLLTHEIIYEHFYKLGEDDSVKARKLNAYLYGKVDAETFWNLVKELSVPIYP